MTIHAWTKSCQPAGPRRHPAWPGMRSSCRQHENHQQRRRLAVSVLRTGRGGAKMRPQNKRIYTQTWLDQSTPGKNTVCRIVHLLHASCNVTRTSLAIREMIRDLDARGESPAGLGVGLFGTNTCILESNFRKRSIPLHAASQNTPDCHCERRQRSNPHA